MNPKSGILNPYGVTGELPPTTEVLPLTVVPFTFPNAIKFPLVSIEATLVPLYLKYNFEEVVVIDQLFGNPIEVGEKLVTVKLVIVALVVTTLVALTVVGLIDEEAKTPL